MSRTGRIPLDFRLIAVEEDVYRFLVGEARDFEDTPSVILRRLLGIGVPGPRVKRVAGLAHARKSSSPKHELSSAIERAAWLPFDVQRYLYLVKCMHVQRSRDFKRILEVRGRTRAYFARSAKEIEESGTATHPRPIHDTGYWALTNLPTRDKERIVRNLMTMFEYGDDAMLAARDYLLRGRIPTMPT